jgi:Mce-associated membrane protein
MSNRVFKLVGVVSVLLAAGVVALASAGGWYYWTGVEIQGERDARAVLVDKAKDQIPKVFGYDYQTVERSLNDIYPWLTPSYRQEFEDRANKDIIPQARQRQLVSQANAVGVGVLAAQRNSGSVMVFLNRTVTDKSKQPIYDGSRLKVDYVKVDGQWLINYITPI